MDDDPATAYERENVHQVYDAIAAHFSQTRYKPWPVVASFLDSVPSGSIGIEVGCGNGKYLRSHNITSPRSSSLPAGARPPAEAVETTPRYLLVGLDRSLPLLQHAPADSERLFGDGCSPLPLRPGVFDFALSIATIHHFSTPARRRQGIETLIEAVVSPDRIARLLVYVWALEQGPASRRRREKGTLLDADPIPGSASMEGDVFVPWTAHGDGDGPPRTLNRYYHLFQKGELEDLVRDAATATGLGFAPLDGAAPEGKGWVRIVEAGFEADNWYATCHVCGH